MKESDIIIRQQKRDHTIFFLNQELNPQLEDGIRFQASRPDFSINCHGDCKAQFVTHRHYNVCDQYALHSSCRLAQILAVV